MSKVLEWMSLIPRFDQAGTVAGQAPAPSSQGDGAKALLVDLTKTQDGFAQNQLPNEELGNILNGGRGKNSVG